MELTVEWSDTVACSIDDGCEQRSSRRWNGSSTGGACSIDGGGSMLHIKT